MTGIPCLRPSATNCSSRYFSGEADNAIITGVDSQQQRGLLIEHRFVVARWVRLVQPTSRKIGAAAAHHVGNPKRSADFHKLAAGDDDFPCLGQGAQSEQHGGGVIIHHEGCLGPREFAQNGFGMNVARSSLTLFEIVFKVVVVPAEQVEALAMASSAIRDRPRLVWTMMPVALMTFWSV